MGHGLEVRIEMRFDEWPEEDEQVDKEEVWSAILYLDPDQRDVDHRKGKSATIIAVFALLLMVWAVWFVLWLRVQGL